MGMMAKIGIENHWLIGARCAHSPNQDVRPIPASEIDLLVIHSISLPPGSFGGTYIEQFFRNQLDPDAHPYFQEISHLRVSAHLLIYRTGETVQFVPFDQRAWHAGESQYQGRSNCNDFSLGIELEGTDRTPYTDNQYAKLAEVTQSLFRSYPRLLPARIVGHSDIAPGRKTDPGPSFDWTSYRLLLQGLSS
jgi:N-acetyl-anhydromuramoyl-L-alanine amidase